jgi:DNA invertase Pin-like site-specific DNA recombinase
MNPTKHVALYARTSTHDQNPGMQVDELRRVAGQRGWQVVGEYVDAGHSGAKDRRPELDRMMSDVQRGKIDMVLVWKFDRFARSVRHLVSALDDFRARNVDFASLHDGIDTSTPVGRFTFHVVSAVAELEREMIRERTRCGIAAARRRGSRIGRPQARVDVLRAKTLLAGGQSLRQVARLLGIGASTLHRAMHENDGVALARPTTTGQPLSTARDAASMGRAA